MDAVQIVCDNVSMVRNVHKLLPSRDTSDSEYNLGKHHTLEPLQPEWDVLNEIWHTVKAWPGLRIAHVKGHQDDTTPAELLPIEAILNVQADALASNFLRQDPTPRYQCHLFPNTHAHLHLEDGTVTYRYAVRIRNAECDPPMIAHLKEKYDWSDEIFTSINWKVHGKAIRAQRHRKTHITKLVHDILPTNRIQHRWNSQQSDKCALCNREVETRDHLLRCNEAGNWRSKCLRNIGLTCEKLRTHRGLYALLIRGLQAWFKGEDRLTAEGYNQEMTTLVYSQNAIGWGQLFNGRWSIHWSLIQGNHMGDDITRRRSPLGDRWNVAVLQDLWEIWHELWTARNEKVHGRDELTRRAAELDILRRRMRNVYAQKNRVEPRVAPILDTPMEHHMARGAVYVSNWLAIHESLVHNSVRRANDRAIRGVRSLHTYFPGHIDDPG